MENQQISILKESVHFCPEKVREAACFLSVLLDFLTNQRLCTHFKISLRFRRRQYLTWHTKFGGSLPKIIQEVFSLLDR